MSSLHPDLDTLERRLRHDLSVVAGTVTGEPATTRKPRRKRLIAFTLGTVIAVPAFAAAAVLHQGPEYVTTIAPDRIVTAGEVDGSRYLLVETERTDECGRPVTGVELVEEDKNLLGSEWNTTGYQYGEMTDTACGYVNDTSPYLENPSLFSDSGAQVGDSFVWIYAVHPDVSTVRVTSGDFVEDLEVHTVDGAGYAVFEIPHDMTDYTSELLIDGHVVPGSVEVQMVPRP
jgi:hypothetical protein